MAKSRNVVYTLDIEAGKANAATAAAAVKHFKEVEKAANAAEAAIKSANSAKAKGGGAAGGKDSFSRGMDKAARNEQRQAAADERRENEANIKASVTAQKAAAKDVANAKKAAAKDALTAQKAASKEAADFDREIRKHVNTLGKQAGQRERHGKQADAMSSKAWKDTGQAVGAAAHAVLSYGQAVVLATVADEKSSQRMLEKIAKLAAFASALNGTISLIKAGTSAWKAYQAAAAAGALAQGAGMAGGAARAGMGGLIAGGLAAGAGKIGGAIASAASNPLTGVALITAGTISAGYSVGMALKAGKSAKQGLMDTGNLLWEGMTEFLGITDRAGDAAKAWNARMASGRENIQSAGQRMIDDEGKLRERGSLSRELAMLGGKTELDRAKAALQHSQGVTTAAERRLDLLPNYASREARDSVTETVKQGRRQELDDVREIHRIEMETRREKIEGERTALGVLRERSRTAQQMLQAERDAKKSAAARFGDLSDTDKARTLAAVRTAKAGGQINRDQRDLLRNIGGIGQTIADESAAKEAYKKGFDEVAAVTHDPRIYGAQARVNTLNTKIETKNDFVIRLEQNADQAANAAYEKLKPMFQKIFKLIGDTNQETANKLQAELNTQAALIGGTSGG